MARGCTICKYTHTYEDQTDSHITHTVDCLYANVTHDINVQSLAVNHCRQLLLLLILLLLLLLLRTFTSLCTYIATVMYYYVSSQCTRGNTWVYPGTGLTHHDNNSDININKTNEHCVCVCLISCSRHCIANDRLTVISELMTSEGSIEGKRERERERNRTNATGVYVKWLWLPYIQSSCWNHKWLVNPVYEFEQESSRISALEVRRYINCRL